MNRHDQMKLFTPGGQAYSPEAFANELRAGFGAHIARVFGSTTVEDEACPSCDAAPLKVALHPSSPFAYCECGWHMDIGEDE